MDEYMYYFCCACDFVGDARTFIKHCEKSHGLEYFTRYVEPRVYEVRSRFRISLGLAQALWEMRKMVAVTPIMPMIKAIWLEQPHLGLKEAKELAEDILNVFEDA